jgi:hypothetical protein
MKASQARRPARARATPRRRPPLHSGRALLGGALLAAGCTIAPAAGTGGSPEPSALPPPGYGTLRQDEVTIQMMSGALEIQVTPLDESVTRVTAPDTYQRLSGMARGHRDRAPQGSQLFLVSFFSDQPGIRFVPEEVHLISRGIRMRPTAILPVTPGWGQNRLQQRQTEMAVYAFPGMIDLEADLVLAYELEESSSWSGILTRVQAERGRARARAGVGS